LRRHDRLRARHRRRRAQARRQRRRDSAEAKQLNKLADDYYDALARFDPVSAGESGDNRFADQIGMSIAPKLRAAQFALYKGFLKRLHAIPREASRSATRPATTSSTTSWHGAALRALPRAPAADQPDGQHAGDAGELRQRPGRPAAGTVKDYQAYLSRLNQLGPWIDQAIANMREGMKRGVVQPKAIMVSALPQFKQLVAPRPEDSIFYTPVTRFPAAFSDADKKKLTAAYRKHDRCKLNARPEPPGDFLEKDYLPACRTSTGWSALPNGDGLVPGARGQPDHRPPCSRSRSTRSA
jgi:uncharacterized protein (DUF885 family)